MEAPAIHPRLRAALDAFRAAGVTPTDEEIAWLVTLRHACDNPSDGSLGWLMGAPLQFGGADWYPMHRLAECWFLRANKLLGGNQRDQVDAYLFAHAHSEPGDVTLRWLSDAATMRDAVRKWSEGLAIPDAALDGLVDRLRVLDGDADSVPDADAPPAHEDATTPDNGARFAAMMCKAFPGASPEFWLTGVAASDARDMLSGVSDEGFAESHERTEAIKNFLKAVKWIWVNHNG